MSQDTEWFSGCTQNANDCTHRATIFPLIAWALVIAFTLAGVFYASRVNADPIARANAENNAVITLYNEPCELKDQITNLPYKAAWVEAGKTFRGCWGPHPAGLAVFYFDDKTTGVIPFQALQRVSGA